jgi:HNH endonuclease
LRVFAQAVERLAATGGTWWDVRDLTRFFDKLEVSEGGCWIWQGQAGANGYGYFSRSRVAKKVKMVLAHRAAYEFFVSEIPGELTIDHICCVKLCVNPSHLRLMTMADNDRRGSSRRKVVLATHCKYGHPLSGANLEILQGRSRPGRRRCIECRRRRDRERSQHENYVPRPHRRKKSPLVTPRASGR